MNGGARRGGGSRVPATPSIPAGVRKTIENIKEIASNHSDEEVYAMLRECAMDPNEATQKLLLQDTFHEVKRRHKKKEGGNKETVDPKFRPANQGPGRRWGTGRFSSRFIHAKEAINVTPVPKENGLNDKIIEKGKAPIEPVSPNKEAKASTSNASPIITEQQPSPKISSPKPKANISAPPPPPHTTINDIINNNNNQSNSKTPPSDTTTNETNTNKSKSKTPPSVTTTNDNNNKTKSKIPPSDAKSKSPPSVTTISDNNKTKSKSPQSVLEQVPVQGAGILTKPPEASLLASAVCSSTADPVLRPSLDERSPRAAIRRPVGSQRTVSNREISQVVSRPANSRPTSSSRPSSGSRPSSSSYNNRGPLGNGPHRVGPNKEWKPKSTSVPAAQQPPSDSKATTDAEPVAVARSVPTADRSVPAADPDVRAVATSTVVAKVEKKLVELQLSQREHVIIPNHLQVPDSEKYGISFGSFDQIVDLVGPTRDQPKKNLELVEPEPELVKEPSEEPISSLEETPSVIHVPEQQPSPTREVTENPIEAPDAELAGQNEQLKEEEEEPTNIESQFSLVNSSFDQVNHVIGTTQPQPLGGPEPVQVQPGFMVNHVLNGNPSQPLDVQEAAQAQVNNDGTTIRQPNVMVQQQPMDIPSSYYSQMYRPTETDGRFSPFMAPGAAIKYGNISVLTGQNGQISSEVANPIMLSSSLSSGIPTPAGGIIQTSLSIPQQSVPVFRHTVAGAVQLSHYPQNYLPYNQYIPPFYVHPSLAFPQQAPAGGMYAPVPAGTAGTAPGQQIRYKPNGTVGPTTGAMYGAYGLGAMGYTGVNSAVVNSGDNDDMGPAHFKENNNVYITGQATEAMWIQGGPARADLSNLGSFYGLTPQGPTSGQHLAFAPTGPIGPTQGLAGMYPPQHHPLLHQQLPAHSLEMMGANNGPSGANGNMYAPPQAPGSQRTTPITWAGSY